MSEPTWEAEIGFDAHFIIRRWDAGAERLFGYTADEVIGRHASDVIPGDGDRMERMVALQRRGIWRGPVVVIDKNGDMLAIENYTVAERDFLGAITGYVGRSRRLPEPRAYTDLLADE